MQIKGIEHLAEISRSTELSIYGERFRYSLRRLDSTDVMYWGHEHSEDAAIQMAKMYLKLLDDCLIGTRNQSGSRRSRVQFLASPAV
jgi:hypothetical protein